jgi:hypothetical protein
VWRKTAGFGTAVLPAAIVALALGAATPAFAQRADGPYSGLFGGQPDENRYQGLDLRASMFGAWDQNLYPASDASAQTDTRLRESGASGGASGTLLYDRRGDRAVFLLNGTANAREYASDPTLVTAYQGGTQLTAKLTDRVNFNAGGAASYSPFFEFAPFLDPGAGATTVTPVTGNFGYAALAERNLGLNGTLGFTDNITRRTSLYINGNGSNYELLDDPANNVRSIGGRAGISHQLTRALGVHAAYGRDQFTYAGSSPYINETIDVGVDYGDTLSFARRTALTFSTSTSAIRYVGDTHYRLNGTARLTRGFSRSWSSFVGYDRATEFRIGFRAPLLTDSASAGLSGQLATRVQWSGGSGYTRGNIGFDSSHFSSYSASSRLDFALTRALALYGQYAYYHYEVPPGSSVLDFVPRFSRQVATVGLSVWVPLVNDVRPPKEPRP